MKLKHILLPIWFIISYCQIAHSQITFQKNVDPKDVVSQLFDSKYNPVDNTFKWIPNKRERLEYYPYENNDTLITKIDTVFDFNENNSKIKLILVSTKPPYFDCHGCQPTLGLIELYFIEENDWYSINYINKDADKFGAWGQTPSICKIIHLSDTENLLMITERDQHGGVDNEISSIYNRGNKIFSFNSYYSDADAKEFEYQRTRYKQSISIDKKKNLMKIIKKGKEPNNKGKIIPVHSISYYTYEDGFLNKKSILNLLPKK